MFGAFSTACRALSLCLGAGLCFGAGPTEPIADRGGQQKAEPAADPLWQIPLDAPGRVRVAVGTDHLFVAGHGPSMQALRVADGEAAWSLPVGAAIDLATGDDVLFALEPTRLRVIDQISGAVRWSLSPLPAPASIATRHGARVTVASGPYVWHGTADAGAMLWELEFPAPVRLLASGADGIAVVLSDNGLYLIDPGRGMARWRETLPAGVVAVTLARGRVYLAGRDRALYGYGAADGDLHWRFGLPALVAGPPAVDEHQVYVALLDNTLRAFDRTDGARRWWRALSDRPVGGPSLIGRDLFVPVTNGAISRSQVTGTGALTRIPSTREGRDAVRLEVGGVLPDGKAVFMITRGLDNVRRLSVWPRP